MTKEIKDQVRPDQVFTVEDVGAGEFQSVFPERLADKSAIHSDEADAWSYINEVIAADNAERKVA